MAYGWRRCKYEKFSFIYKSGNTDSNNHGKRYRKRVSGTITRINYRIITNWYKSTIYVYWCNVYTSSWRCGSTSYRSGIGKQPESCKSEKRITLGVRRSCCWNFGKCGNSICSSGFIPCRIFRNKSWNSGRICRNFCSYNDDWDWILAA